MTHLPLSNSQHQSMFDLVVAVAQHSDEEIKFALLCNDRMPRMDVTGKPIQAKPVAGVDFDPDEPMCQDDYEYFTNTGRYADGSGWKPKQVISGAETDGTDSHDNNPKKDELAQIVSTCTARSVEEREATVKAERNARRKTEWVEELDVAQERQAAAKELQVAVA